MREPPADLARLGALARLELRAEQEAELRQRLVRILAAFRSLAAVPVTDLDADPGPPYPVAGPRPDEAGPVLEADLVLGNARRAAAGAFLVPRVVEG